MTPGLRLIRLSKLRPLSGRSFTSRSPTIPETEDVVVDDFVLVFLDVPVVVEPLVVSSLAVLVLLEVLVSLEDLVEASVSLEDLVEVWEATEVVCSEVEAVVDSSKGQSQRVRTTRE